ncbi:hypothetical protein [Lacticaseibacillus parakribbianus]|uniref:hypothetical protein n=1 Tax=Lacticaseibacillus parakribbianus TaxID=2970927 RepID=UPI0021CB3405|nr:hypothetical protein [Lacticaseibacillus parakribbianus]
MAVKAQASISLALVSDGKAGATGPAGPPGPAGKDITSYASGTVIPSTVPPANSQFWLIDSAGIATKFYRSDGTNWIEQPISASAISAATFNGLTFNGVIFNGSKFVSSFSRQSVDAAGVQSELTTTGSGTATLGDGYLVIDGKIDDASSDEAFHTEVGPSGVSNRVTSDLGVERSVSLSMGELSLYSKESDASPAYIGTLTSEKLQQINNTGNMLWSGAWKMAASTTLTVEKNINECLNGWALLWSGGDTNAPQNYNYTTTYISKGFAARHSGAGVHMDLGGTKTLDAAFKYCYFTQTTIKGNDANATGTSNNYVLREVFEW